MVPSWPQVWSPWSWNPGCIPCVPLVILSVPGRQARSCAPGTWGVTASLGNRGILSPDLTWGFSDQVEDPQNLCFDSATGSWEEGRTENKEAGPAEGHLWHVHGGHFSFPSGRRVCSSAPSHDLYLPCHLSTNTCGAPSMDQVPCW